MRYLNSNPFKTWWQARKYFKFPKISVWIGLRYYGLPVFWDQGIGLEVYDLVWKDKNGTPRFEYAPAINLIIWKYQIILEFGRDQEAYWEQLVWFLYYSSHREPRTAASEWPWRDKDNINTWDWIYLKKKWYVKYVDRN